MEAHSTGAHPWVPEFRAVALQVSGLPCGHLGFRTVVIRSSLLCTAGPNFQRCGPCARYS